MKPANCGNLFSANKRCIVRRRNKSLPLRVARKSVEGQLGIGILVCPAPGRAAPGAAVVSAPLSRAPPPGSLVTHLKQGDVKLMPHVASLLKPLVEAGTFVMAK